jgi:hypothetical protein
MSSSPCWALVASLPLLVGKLPLTAFETLEARVGLGRSVPGLVDELLRLVQQRVRLVECLLVATST